MSSASNVVAMLQNIKAMAGEEVFASALASMMPSAPVKAKTEKVKDPNAPKRSVPAGVTAWTEHVKSVLADMIENGWEPFSVKDTHFAGSEATEEGHVFADSRKKPTYSQALTVAKIRKGSSASSVASEPAEEPEKKKGGRPKGSKNKPKTAEELPLPAPAAPAAPASLPLPESEAEDEGHASDSSSQKKRGRKPMTAEQKAAAKAEREAKMAAMTPEELAAFNAAKAAKKEANKAKKAAKEAKA
jgi:hypothetical protein